MNAPIPPISDGAACIRRAVGLLCARMCWAALHEFTFPNGRRADLLALMPDGRFACIEVKSCARDFLTDGKWHEYCDYCDALYFAVDSDFPLDLLPEPVGLILTAGHEAEIARDAPAHVMAPARRRALLQRFAFLGATRLAMLQDPAIGALRTALRVD